MSSNTQIEETARADLTAALRWASRLGYGMARDGLLPKALGRVHERISARVAHGELVAGEADEDHAVCEEEVDEFEQHLVPHVMWIGKHSNAMVLFLAFLSHPGVAYLFEVKDALQKKGRYNTRVENGRLVLGYELNDSLADFCPGSRVGEIRCEVPDRPFRCPGATHVEHGCRDDRFGKRGRPPRRRLRPGNHQGLYDARRLGPLPDRAGQ